MTIETIPIVLIQVNVLRHLWVYR